MKIAICDDEKIIHEDLQKALYIWPNYINLKIDFFSNGIDLLRQHAITQYDFILLDIEMSELNGLEVAKKIREIDKQCLIAFLTSHEELAIEGYEVNAVRFLKKPLQPTKLYECLDYVYEKIEIQGKISITTCDGEKFLNIQDILLVEAQNKTVEITQLNGNIIQGNEQLSSLEKLLAPYGFFKCHRSYLISLSHVIDLNKNFVRLTNQKEVPVSRNTKKKLEEQLFQKIIQQTRGN